MENNIPKCPRCGSEMIYQVARKGKYKGISFWGCSRFPKCKKIIDGEPARELKDELVERMKETVKVRFEKIQSLINEIWKLEKKEKFGLRIKFTKLIRKIADGKTGTIIYGRTNDNRDLAANASVYEKEKRVVEASIREIEKEQLKKLKEIEDIIKTQTTS